MVYYNIEVDKTEAELLGIDQLTKTPQVFGDLQPII